MAVKLHDRFFSGEMWTPDRGHYLGEELTDIRPSDERMDCKYCHTDDAPTVESHEHLTGHTMQLLCALCGAGLTACDPFPPGAA